MALSACVRQLLSWKPHKGALAYSGTALGYSLMHPVFSFYYVKVFLDIYKIPESSFQTVQLLYMIWNAINDPLFGYCQDNSRWSIVQSRRHTILYGAPLFALSFLVPWFPWGDYSSENGHWLVGLHLLVSLFFYDAMFTYVLLASGCLCAEMSSHHEDRIQMMQYGAIAVLIGSSSVFLCEQVSEHLHYFGRFQCLCVVLGVLAYFAMSFTGRNAITMYDKPHQEDSTKKVSDRSTGHSIWKLTWQILSNPNFFWFVTMNFMTEFHGTFTSNFCMIIVDTLVPKDTVPLFQWSLFYGLVMFLPRLFFIVMRPLMSSVGYYKITKTLILLKFAAAFTMYMIGTGWPRIFMLFLMVDSLMAHSMGSMFGLISSDIIDDDFHKHNRHHPMSSMVMGTNALVTKPAQSLAPMLTVYYLNSHGYEAMKAGTLASTDDLHSAMFLLACLLPVCIAVIQFVCWSRYALRDSHVRGKKDGDLEDAREVEELVDFENMLS